MRNLPNLVWEKILASIVASRYAIYLRKMFDSGCFDDKIRK